MFEIVLLTGFSVAVLSQFLPAEKKTHTFKHQKAGPRSTNKTTGGKAWQRKNGQANDARVIDNRASTVNPQQSAA